MSLPQSAVNLASNLASKADTQGVRLSDTQGVRLSDTQGVRLNNRHPPVV